MGEDRDLDDLTAGLRKRRPEAWERLYALTHLPLLRLLDRLLRDRSLAEETLQATYLTAIERIAGFDPGRGSVDAWLAGIARHKAQEAARERRRSPSEDGLARVAAPLNAPLNGHGSEEELVALALDALEPRYAKVLRRKYLAEEALETIARDLKLKVATVGTLLHRGRERFREMYVRLEKRAEKTHGQG